MTDIDDAVDLPLAERPGVPAKHTPEPVGHAHGAAPLERQSPSVKVTMDSQRTALTATFGTGQPPRGLSGLLRRAAYRWPDYKARRWALLLFADRVDAFEDRSIRMARSPFVVSALIAGIALFVANRSSRRPTPRWGRTLLLARRSSRRRLS